MRWIPVLLLVTAALAGCADSPAPIQDTPRNDADAGLVATKDTGVIRGIVVDETITPIEGAQIVLVHDGSTTRSLADGSFGFSGLEPGLYFMQVTKPGYEGPVLAQSQVEADVALPPIVRISMVADPSSAPYYEIIPWRGYLQCGAGSGSEGASVNPCAVFEIGSILAGEYGTPDPCIDIDCSDNTFDVEVGAERKPDLVQIEMAWTGSQALGNAMSLGIFDPATTASNFVGVTGESPLLLRVEADRMAGALGADYLNYTVRVFPSAAEDTPTLFLDQEFEVFVIHFYGFLPQDDYRLVEDGEPIVPT